MKKIKKSIDQINSAPTEEEVERSKICEQEIRSSLQKYNCILDVFANITSKGNSFIINIVPKKQEE